MKTKTLTIKQFSRLKKLALWGLEVSLVTAKTNLMSGGADGGIPGSSKDLDDVIEIEHEIAEIKKL